MNKHSPNFFSHLRRGSAWRLKTILIVFPLGILFAVVARSLGISNDDMKTAFYFLTILLVISALIAIIYLSVTSRRQRREQIENDKALDEKLDELKRLVEKEQGR